jgi:uncharacterized protein YodC (DUF2158 family)
MTKNIKVGDVVRLKSGSPKMTVTIIDEDESGNPRAWCLWFEGTKKLDSDFPISVLEHPPEPESATMSGGSGSWR